ncbi:MAG: hypothetical protein AAF821_10870 [Cyanobacteria bacterium P01_D01_bin.156]
MASSQDKSPAPAGANPDNAVAPQLESVLQNLNVNLEDELTRYRRQRHGRVPPPPPPRRKAQRQTIDLISVSATPSEPATSSPPSASPVPPPPPPNPFLKGQSVDDTDVDLPDLAALTEPPQQELETSAYEDEVLGDTSLPVHTSEAAPDDYLESSEELLKSLADEQADPESLPEPYSPDRKNNSLLKLAGLVLVLLAGVGVGFAITYPSQVQKLRSQLFPGDTSPDAVTSSEEPAEATTESIPQESPDPEPPPASDTGNYKPPGPDLSQREFVELDLESLSTLDVDGATPTAPVPPLSNPAQSPLPQPNTTSPATSAPNTTVTAEAPSTPVTPVPAGEAPSGDSPTSAPVPAPVATGPNFYVVTSYTGDASLNKAREFVPDAFIRNFKAGARIQLAAFDNRAQAEDQVAALTQQGMTVELFGPTTE